MEPDLINQYAVVNYLRGPLSHFVNGLRCELTPGCPHRAHLTILPPRELNVTDADAVVRCQQSLHAIEPFAVRITDVNLFEETQVIKLAVHPDDAERLRDLHRQMNVGALKHEEKYPYTPHITICMEAGDVDLKAFLDLAKKRWEEFGGQATVWIDALTFVQQRSNGSWVDLAEIPLGQLAPAAC